MKDKYGYIKVEQKNYDPKYQTGTILKARKVMVEGKPEVRLAMEIWTMKGKGDREMLYREYGYITLKDEQLAEIAELFK